MDFLYKMAFCTMLSHKKTLYYLNTNTKSRGLYKMEVLLLFSGLWLCIPVQGLYKVVVLLVFLRFWLWNLIWEIHGLFRIEVSGATANGGVYLVLGRARGPICEAACKRGQPHVYQRKSVGFSSNGVYVKCHAWRVVVHMFVQVFVIWGERLP